MSGVGLAAVRDAAAAFRYRSDLPIHGQHAYAFGVSQAGRFLRQFLYEGFNLDERNRRVFDAMWMHIAGAARVGFNERFATQTLAELFTATQFPLRISTRSMSMVRRRPAVSLSAGSTSEGVLHEHSGRILGWRAGCRAHAYEPRWQAGSRAAGETSGSTC